MPVSDRGRGVYEHIVVVSMIIMSAKATILSFQNRNMLSLILSAGLFGAATCLPQSPAPSKVVACYTLPLEFAVNVQFSIYRPCFCIRDHNALVTLLGRDEPCLVSPQTLTRVFTINLPVACSFSGVKNGKLRSIRIQSMVLGDN